MATHAPIREERVEIRIRSLDKKILEKAAVLSGVSVSSFMLSNALKAAQDEISSQNRIHLSDREWNAFMRVLEHPPKPNQALITAAKRYRRA
jgi:uncharacterized protein (DUF1778 family)